MQGNGIPHKLHFARSDAVSSEEVAGGIRAVHFKPLGSGSQYSCSQIKASTCCWPFSYSPFTYSLFSTAAEIKLSKTSRM